MRLRFSLAAGLFVALLTGCATVGPDYVPPEKKVPEKFNSSLDKGEKAKSISPQSEEDGQAVKVPNQTGDTRNACRLVEYPG